MEPPALHWQMDEILIDIREDNIRKHSPELLATLLKDHTMSRAKVVICKTPMAKRITKRTLVGFRPIKVNTRYFEDLINQIKNKPANFIEKVKRGKSFWKTNNNDNMNFNAIVGNPPYQVMDGGAGVSAKPVYNTFVDVSKNINPLYISMIMPSRWFAGGKGLDSFRESMLSDKRISNITDFVNAKDCFPKASIGGGVNYILWDKFHNGDCKITTIQNGTRDVVVRSLSQFAVFIRYNQAVHILNKMQSDKSFSILVNSRNPFGLSSNTRGSDVGKVKLVSSDGISYIPLTHELESNPLTDTYKILLSKVTSEHAGEPDKQGKFKILSRTEIIGPYTVCTDSYLILAANHSKEYVCNSYKYICTKFARFLLMLAVSSINLSQEKFQFVPMQDFTEGSDIDWSKSVAEIDRQLYSKYGLTEEEIAFIESMIKPM